MNLDKRLLQLLQAVRMRFALAMGVNLAAGILLVAQAYALSQVISRVFLEGDDLAAVSGLLVALAAIGVLRTVMLWGGEVAACTAAGRIKARLRERLLVHLAALGPAYTTGERSGELANTAITGIEELDAYFSEYLPQLGLAALIPLTMLVVVFPLDALSGVVLLLTAPLIPFFMIMIGVMASKVTREQWGQLSRLSAHFLDVLQGLTTLKIFGRSRDQINVIARISTEFGDTTLRVLRVAFLSALALELIATLSTAMIAVEIGLRLLYGHIAFEHAFFVLILAPEFYLPLRMLGTRFHAGMSGTTAAARIFEVLETQAPPQPPNPLPTPEGPFAIRFDDVHFAYENGARPALNGLNMAIEPGQKVALVGPSGAGKSTTAQLLLTFIQPTAGNITINGIDLAHLDAASWRTQVAWVPQRPYLFADSIAANIRLARPDASLAAVQRAAEQARAAEFIHALPQSYDTSIGERGARLSGGQAQRIALARAFLKDAPLLILDEPTANLDPGTEHLLQAAMRDLMQNRTTLIIAHRLATIMDADQIVVLDGGRVVESGKHLELTRNGGSYRAMITALG